MCSQQCAQTMKCPMSVQCEQQLYIETSEKKIWWITNFDLLFAEIAKKILQQIGKYNGLTCVKL